MGAKRNKSVAIVFIILFLGYYQRWLYAILYESISGTVDLDPALPMILDSMDRIHSGGVLVGHNRVGESLDDRMELQLQLAQERESASAGIPPMTFLKTDQKLQEKADQLSERILREIIASQHFIITTSSSSSKTKADIVDTKEKIDDHNDQTQTQNINALKSCKGPKIHCGSSVDCGLGCQIHSIMSCLMVSYLTNRTLIPDFRKWPYSIPWTDVLKPVGKSECPTDNETAVVRWGKPGFSIILPDNSVRYYKSGLPVPMSIGTDLKRLPTDHFLWWISQFAKYALRLQPWEEELMKKFKDVLKLHLPTVGVVVRKRDKHGEKRKLESHSIDKYMSVAKKYFSKLEETQDNVTRRVFLSTDDRNVFKLFRKRYRPPKWEILGFQRKTDVEDIIKDIYMLSECNFVVCSFSADICRLVLELKESKELNSIYKVKSLGYKYFYSTQGFNRLRFLLRY